MTRETLLECINNVDEDLVESVPTERIIKRSDKKSNISVKTKCVKYVVLAACIVAAIGLGRHAFWKTKEQVDNRMVESEQVTLQKQEVLKGVGDGTEFLYNNNNYRVVESEEFLTSNSLPMSVAKKDTGDCLKNNVGDINNNIIIGDLYEYKKCNDWSVLVVKLLDGTYKLAVDEGKY